MKPVSYHSIISLIVVSCGKAILPAGCFVVLLISWADDSVYANQVQKSHKTGITGIYLLFLDQHNLTTKRTVGDNSEKDFRNIPGQSSKTTDIIKLRILVKRSAFSEGIR